MATPTELHALFQASSLRQLVTLGRELISNPIILTDLTHQVLETSEEPDLTDPKWLEIQTHRAIPLNPAISNIYHESLNAHRPVLDRSAADGMGILRVAISHGGQLIGFMEVPCYHGLPDEEEQALITFIADVACLIMKRDLDYMDSPSNMTEFFISDLLEGRIQDELLIQARWQRFHLPRMDSFRVMTVTGESECVPRDRDRQEAHRTRLGQLFPNVACFVYGDKLKLIVPTQEDTVHDGRFFDDMITYLKDNRLRAGISRSSPEMAQITRCNMESIKALNMGLLLKSDEILFFYDKYSIYHALETCAESVDVMQFCHSALFTLATYDRTHDTALLETLHAYLYSKHNLADAAAKLYIHRNTLTNRLTKINDLVHADLEDSETTFHLMFSFHILEYYASTVALDYEKRIRLSPTLKHQ